MSTHSRLDTAVMIALIAVVTACGQDADGSGQGPGGRGPAGRDDHAESAHEGHDEIHLEPEQLDELGIEVSVAGPGPLRLEVELPGEVRINGDLMAHVVPRVGGVVRQVNASLGDTVRQGEVLAVLDSRELADAQAGYLAARERLVLADATFQREERLHEQRVTSEQDFFDARERRAEARIALRLSQQKLKALGIEASVVEALPDRHQIDLTYYRVTAPFDGTVVDRHMTLGETVEADAPVFTVADLSQVWVDLSVYQKDIGVVLAGYEVVLRTNHGDEAVAAIAFVQPIVGEATRTALARIVMPNPGHVWHPGCFVTATVVTDRFEAPVRVPLTAVIPMGDEGEPVLFVDDGEAFVARAVRLGRRDSRHAEVEEGLEAGERYVAKGGFSLKAELAKESFGDGHGH